MGFVLSMKFKLLMIKAKNGMIEREHVCMGNKSHIWMSYYRNDDERIGALLC